MGLELICDSCQAPMCAFSHRRDGARVCMSCISLGREVTEDQRIVRALGALHAGSSGYMPRGAIYVDMGSTPALAVKTKALIKHDRILRGEA